MFKDQMVCGMSGMLALCGLVFVLLTQKVYIHYPIANHIEVGTYMILIAMLNLFIVFPFYIVKKTLDRVKATR
jgi:hypothetical protein